MNKPPNGLNHYEQFCWYRYLNPWSPDSVIVYHRYNWRLWQLGFVEALALIALLVYGAMR